MKIQANHIRSLVIEGRTREAIQFAIEAAAKDRKDLSNYLILISAQYEMLAQKKLEGTLSPDDRTVNNINKSLLSIASRFEKNRTSIESYEGKIISLSKKYNYGFISTDNSISRDNIFFHFSELKDSKSVKTGQLVVFKTSTYKNNIVAAEISPKEKVLKRPPFSRASSKKTTSKSKTSEKPNKRSQKKSTPSVTPKSKPKTKVYLPKSLTEGISLLKIALNKNKKK